MTVPDPDPMTLTARLALAKARTAAAKARQIQLKSENARLKAEHEALVAEEAMLEERIFKANTPWLDNHPFLRGFVLGGAPVAGGVAISITRDNDWTLRRIAIGVGMALVVTLFFGLLHIGVKRLRDRR